MPTLAANQSLTVNLPAGQILRFDTVGQGIVTLQNREQVEVGKDQIDIGPFAFAQELSVSATSDVRWNQYDADYLPNRSGSIELVSGNELQPNALNALQVQSTTYNSMTPVGYETLRTGASTVGWTLTNNSGATATMAMDMNSPLGGPALKVTIPNDTGNVDLIATGLGLPNFTQRNGKLVFVAYVANELGIKQFRPYVGISGLARNMDYTYGMSNNNQFRINGVNVIDIHAGKASANNLLPTDEVDTMRVRVSAQAGGGEFWVRGIYMPSKPVNNWFVITFDDADISMYTRVHKELAKRGLKGTFNINWGEVGTNDAQFVNERMLAEMYEYGHDLTSHNLINTAYPSTNPPTAQPNDAARLTYCQAYASCRNQLLRRNYTRALGFHVYVQGAYDGALNDAMRAHGVYLARAANNNQNVEPLFMQDQRVVSQRSMGNVSTLANIQDWILKAQQYGQDFVAMGHVLADTSSNSITLAQSIFSDALDFALAQGMKIGSVSEWAKDRGFRI